MSSPTAPACARRSCAGGRCRPRRAPSPPRARSTSCAGCRSPRPPTSSPATTDREVLERFARGTAPTRTVLLVRHGPAGSGSTWDRRRPRAPARRVRDRAGRRARPAPVALRGRLDPVGRHPPLHRHRRAAGRRPGPRGPARAAALAGRLPGPRGGGGGAAPPPRRRRARRGGVQPGRGDPGPGRSARRRPTTTSSRGRSPSRKGSTWALTIDAEGRLVAADYLEPPRPPACAGNGSLARR